MGSHDSEEFGQPGASFGAQVLHEVHVDVVVTWGYCWFRLLQSSWNLVSEWMRKTLVWHLLQKSSAMHTKLAFKLLVMQCFSNLDEMSSNGIGADWRMSWLGWLLSSVSVPQLFRLEWVKFIFDVSSSQWCRRARSSDSSYCFSKSWHSSSKHGVYVGRKPCGMEWRDAFCIAPQKCWYDSSTLILLTGISGIERSVARV